MAGCSTPAERSLSLRLSSRFRELADVHLLDYGDLQARHCRARFVNEREWASSRLPLAVEALGWLAQVWWRYVSIFALPQARNLGAQP